MYKIKVGVSFEHPDKGFQSYSAGESADLAGWPPDDLTRFEAEGIIERIADTPLEKPGRKITDKTASAPEGSN